MISKTNLNKGKSKYALKIKESLLKTDMKH